MHAIIAKDLSRIVRDADREPVLQALENQAY
jgi:hypothetical protein